MSQSWLVFVYKVPSEPARNRTFVWRRLNQLHALYVQQAVALLPDTETNVAALEQLAAHVREIEGAATLLRAEAIDAAWEKEILASFNADRDAKYAKIREEIAKFEDEIKLEKRRQRYTPEEVEELEERLEGLRRWLDKVERHDLSKSKGAAETRRALQSAEERLESFASRVEAIESRKQEIARTGVSRDDAKLVRARRAVRRRAIARQH